jgi:hypothetical protein
LAFATWGLLVAIVFPTAVGPGACALCVVPSF